MMRAAHKTDNGGTDGKQEPLPCKDMEQGIHPPLDHQGERGKKYQRGKETVQLRCKLGVHAITPLYCINSAIRI
jgi:hypothetical protein